jgi:hypothetical protein
VRERWGILRGMDDSIRKRLVPGAKVKVVQQIAHRIRERAYADAVVGTVVEYGQKKTGSWFAHSKGDKLWLDRLKLRLENGELTTLVLDEYSHIEVEAEPAAGAGAVGEVKG